MYAEATGLATGQGYRVEYKPRDGYTVTLGKDA
jgi:hypothetical protein